MDFHSHSSGSTARAPSPQGQLAQAHAAVLGLSWPAMHPEEGDVFSISFVSNNNEPRMPLAHDQGSLGVNLGDFHLAQGSEQEEFSSDLSLEGEQQSGPSIWRSYLGVPRRLLSESSTISGPELRSSPESTAGTDRRATSSPAKPARRKRNKCSPEQLASLEAFFAKNRNPTGRVREELSRRLKMPERSVQVWFQNR